MKPIYLDYAATTPVDPRVAAKMTQCLTLEGSFANPASNTHDLGEQAKQLVEQARTQVANAINAQAKEIIWTSGATEADNLAIKGAAEFYQNRGKHIITVKTEHKAVIDSCKVLEKQGFTITYITPEKTGLIDLEKLTSAVTPDTILISVMLVNNETGIIQNIQAISKLAKQNNILVHVDAAQAIGKIAVDADELNIDLMSLSAHKAYGPKGIGALYVRRKPRVKLTAQIHGGGHEQGMRSGTLATHQIVGMGEAFAIAQQELAKDQQHAKQLQTILVNGLAELDNVILNTDIEHSTANIVNASFAGIDGDALLTALDGIAVSTGSACNSVSIEPSYVLQAMGISNELAHSAIRFSYGRFTTIEDMQQAVQIIQHAVKRLQNLAPKSS